MQATVTYRVTDPALASTRLDFGIDPDTGLWRATPLEQLGGLLTELAQQTALDLLARMTLTEALSEGMAALRQAVEHRPARGPAADRDRDRRRGRPRGRRTGRERDVERALQTPTREMVQQAADKATYERRAMAVERERSIAENELQNQIELARREEQLVNQQRPERAAARDRGRGGRSDRDARPRPVVSAAAGRGGGGRQAGDRCGGGGCREGPAGGVRRARPGRRSSRSRSSRARCRRSARST